MDWSEGEADALGEAIARLQDVNASNIDREDAAYTIFEMCHNSNMLFPSLQNEAAERGAVDALIKYVVPMPLPLFTH